MRITTWNVNSVRTRLPRLLAWLEANEPDCLCLQEIKVVAEDFPFGELEARGWRAEVHGQKTYNGVALISRHEIAGVERGFGDGEAEDPQARLLAGTVAGVRVASVYVPNGSKPGSDKYAYKTAFLERLARWSAERVGAPGGFALCGDFNIAPEARDVKEVDAWRGGVLFNEEMTAAFQALLAAGLVDTLRAVNEGEGPYTWWDYRGLAFPRDDGLRIDHVLASESLAARCTEVVVDRDQRKKGACPEGSTPSDHVPVTAVFADA